MILNGWIVQGVKRNGTIEPDQIGDSCFFMGIACETAILRGDYGLALDIWQAVVIDASCIRHPQKSEYQRDGAKKFQHLLNIYPEFKRMILIKFGHNGTYIPLGEGLGLGRSQGWGILSWFQEYPFKPKSFVMDCLWSLYAPIICLQIILYEFLGHYDWIEGFYGVHLAFIDYDGVTGRSKNKLLRRGMRLIFRTLKFFGHVNQYIEYRLKEEMSPIDFEWGHTEFCFQRDMRKKEVVGIETNHNRVGNNDLVSHGLDKDLYEAMKWNLKTM